MHAGHPKIAVVFFAFLTAGNVTAAEFTPSAPAISCSFVYRRPGFASVDEFVERMGVPTGLWRHLLATARLPELGDESQAEHPFSKGVQTTYRSRTTAIVFVHRKVFRTSPYRAVIFLLVKDGRRFHVADFIYRATNDESYADIDPPEILPLAPRERIHLHFSESFGGRKMGFDTDELYIVGGHRFHRTLLLCHDGAFLSPAAPYGEFTQDAKISVFQGRPNITVHRRWTNDNGEQQQEFSVLCGWNPRTEKFTSVQLGRICLKIPPVLDWRIDGLPKPPAPHP